MRARGDPPVRPGHLRLSALGEGGVSSPVPFRAQPVFPVDGSRDRRPRPPVRKTFPQNRCPLGQAGHRRGPRPARHRVDRRHPGGRAFRGAAAACPHRPGHGQRTGAAHPRRTHGRSRPRGARFIFRHPEGPAGNQKHLHHPGHARYRQHREIRRPPPVDRPEAPFLRGIRRVLPIGPHDPPLRGRTPSTSSATGTDAHGSRGQRVQGTGYRGGWNF